MSEEKLSWPGSALLGPVPPVLVSCGEGESANLITIAWAGTVCTQPPRVSISVRPTRHSYGLINESGEFVINLPTTALAKAVELGGGVLALYALLPLASSVAELLQRMAGGG